MGHFGQNLGKKDFWHLTQEFESEVIDLVKHNLFYCYEYIK